jgi:7-cyano-7-deazaguanine synthase
MKKAIISLSGGMDSTTVLGAAIDAGREVECVGFTYGSKHNFYENIAAQEVAEHYNVPFHLMDLSEMMSSFNSNLLKSGGDIPEGHYEAETMSQTVVPGRNIIFASMLSGYAWSRDADEVWLGIHSGDHAIYPDCRPEFYEKMREAILAGTDDRVTLQAPFLDGNKTSIIEWGLQHEVPYHLTRTCYKDQPIACGRCGACQERLEAFRNNNLEDPIEYEFRGDLSQENV